MSVIIDRTGLNETFGRMVDPALRQRECLHAAPAHDDLRRTLDGARVPIHELRTHPMSQGGFTVMRLERIAGTDIDVYGVCVTDEDSRADLKSRGLIDDSTPTFALLGEARAAAADRNSTSVRRAFGQHLQTNGFSGDGAGTITLAALKTPTPALSTAAKRSGAVLH